ncbi:hypothetical protein GCM10011506_26730 [Marivirga lumbricoides]|uniref:Tetratricopeptide repeat-like domain-containing protein n=1 Tax=Marivirga lumbricoides TaxID=1046115 RepID=A0ABQ1MFL9_9BACT|nr:hypothetical protein GCM10011506_26730 [Marivirga lumbricoides]
MLRYISFLIFVIAITHSTIVVAQADKDVALANEYYQQGELDKALTLYEKLAKKPQNVFYIHNSYLELLEIKQLNKQAEKYLKQVVADFSTNIRFDVDIIDFYLKNNDTIMAEKYYEQLENKVTDQLGLLQSAAQYMHNKQHDEYTEKLYLAAREKMRDPTAFSIQLANLYRYTNQKDKMIREFMVYAQERPTNIRYVKNMLQLSLTEEEDLHSFINFLMENIQKNADQDLYGDLLIWANLQVKNFYGAFIQARAIDKRAGLQGENSLEIGQIAYENEAYDIAEKVFQFISDTYPDSRNYIFAKQMLIQSKEKIIKESLPVDTAAIRSLVKAYDQLIDQMGLSLRTLEPYRQKALLHAFYLQEPEKAATILQEIINFYNADPSLIAQAKLDLGDIYIILEQPWESVLLYYQVEKANKNSQLGEDAKLRNAKLSFFKGEFELAQEHLDILKNATRKEIANDAMDLSILIKNNTILDSTQKALRAYASVDLLLYQNKRDEAVQKLNEMLIEFSEHPIKDDALKLLAKIKTEQGKYQEAIDNLDEIVNEMPYDILTDDALFEMATIYEQYLKDEAKAKALYQQLLTDFPGSIYVAEARKRFRSLRGDFVN